MLQVFLSLVTNTLQVPEIANQVWIGFWFSHFHY